MRRTSKVSDESTSFLIVSHLSGLTSVRISLREDCAVVKLRALARTSLVRRFKVGALS